ncbi:MAG: replicative DNA helicase [Elsteraceae bacterium]
MPDDVNLNSPPLLPSGGGKNADFRQLPHSEEAEMALLGAIMYDNRAFDRIGDFLQENHFAIVVHRRVFAAMSRMINEKGQFADPITLKQVLENDPDFAAAGGYGYLLKLAASAPPVVHVGDYGRLIYDLYLRRELIAVGNNMIADAYDEDIDKDAPMQIASAEDRLFNLAQTGASETGFQAFRKALTDAVRSADAASRRDGKIAGVPSGLRDLDEMLGGLHNSDLLILAARPAMGKTALATNIAFNACRAIADPETGRHYTVGYFSLEMSAEQLATRILSEETGIRSESIRRGDLSNEDFEKLVTASQELERLNLFIDDTPALSITSLRIRAKRLYRQHQLSLLIVDYLQLLQGPPGARIENRVQEVSQITRGLKAIAKELNIPVIALSQLSRQVESREDKRPMLADLRESGSIEQDADMVMFIYREQYYLNNSQPDQRPDEAPDKFQERFDRWKERCEQVWNKAEVIIAKQRHGPTGTVELHFDQNTTKFSDLAREDRLPEQRF